MKNLIVVCGPTASGKTRLGVSLAMSVDGEIISADSRQVYRGMDIGTGKDRGEYTREGRDIPCHLIDIADPSAIYTIYEYQRDFFRVFGEIVSRGRIPVMVGGSGLYIEAVLKSYDIPAVPENPRLRADLMARAQDDLCRELHERNPQLYSRTDTSTKKRTVRALEIALTTDNFPEPPPLPEIALDPLVIGVRWPRATLYQRITTRLHERLRNGMVDEVSGLLDSGITPERLALLGMEYKHIGRYLLNETGYDQMVGELSRDIRHLAKRQETWFRGMERRGIAIHWVTEGNLDDALAIIRDGGFPARNVPVR